MKTFFNSQIICLKAINKPKLMNMISNRLSIPTGPHGLPRLNCVLSCIQLCESDKHWFPTSCVRCSFNVLTESVLNCFRY